MARPDNSPHIILVADDSSDDVFFVERAIREACNKSITVVRDGEYCIDYLSDKNNPRPDVIILDVKMPRADGHEVLAWLRAQPDLMHIPVVVMSGSAHPDDRARSLSAGAKAYFAKPIELSEIIHIVRQCGRDWAQWRASDDAEV
jgi:two-component system response regulator